MSDIGEPTQGAEATAEAPQIDNAALLSRMDELAGEIKGLREAPAPQYEGGLNEALNPQQPEPVSAYDDETGYDPYDQSGYDQYQQPQVDPVQAQQQAMQELQTFIQTQVQQGVQQQVQPWIHQQEVTRLEQTYPDLQKPEVVGPLVEEARRFAEQLGNPQLATSPAE